MKSGAVGLRAALDAARRPAAGRRLGLRPEALHGVPVEYFDEKVAEMFLGYLRTVSIQGVAW